MQPTISAWRLGTPNSCNVREVPPTRKNRPTSNASVLGHQTPFLSAPPSAAPAPERISEEPTSRQVYHFMKLGSLHESGRSRGRPTPSIKTALYEGRSGQ